MFLYSQGKTFWRPFFPSKQNEKFSEFCDTITWNSEDIQRNSVKIASETGNLNR